MVHVSTDAVFDGLRGNYSETDAPNPVGVYSRTKLEGEQAVAETYPEAIIARVNLFGWSLSGDRSLAEFFFNHLSQGNRVMGFTDVYFCPLLANHMADILVDMLESNLSGIYHVVCPESLTKYDFGVRLAQRFGLDESLITPTAVSQAGLAARRSPNLTLRVDKLIRALGSKIPDITMGLNRFYELYQQGYPASLHSLCSG